MRLLPIVAVLVLAVTAVVLTQPSIFAGGTEAADTVAEPVTCIEPAETVAGKTTEDWRAEGPEGLAKLIEAIQPSIELYATTDPSLTPAPEQNTELAEAQAQVRFLDRVAQQRDAYADGLYWYTDLDKAIEAAQRTGKPILSLRMLGKLVDEYSCANSRFFRTVLYTDQSVGDLLRERFVLHWQSVRPVPVITIDMGDGRTLKRTITGNSAHYVLDPNGRVVDCLPGLYGPDTFERLVQQAGDLAETLKDQDDQTLTTTLASYHREQVDSLDRLWGTLVAGPNAAHVVRLQPSTPMPTAREAGVLARSKFAVEAPLVLAVSPTPEQAEDDPEVWQRVAQHYASGSRLDSNSRSLLARKLPHAEQAAPIAYGKKLVESPLLRVVRNFEAAIAVDTARNEHLLRRQIHGWFIEADGPLDLTALNRRVYTELFLTPDDDPWLGLVPADTYTALDDAGLSE